MALCSGWGLTGTLGNLLVGACRERAVARDDPLPRAREFDLVLVAMRSTVPATCRGDRLTRRSGSDEIPPRAYCTQGPAASELAMWKSETASGMICIQTTTPSGAPTLSGPLSVSKSSGVKPR